MVAELPVGLIGAGLEASTSPGDAGASRRISYTQAGGCLGTQMVIKARQDDLWGLLLVRYGAPKS